MTAWIEEHGRRSLSLTARCWHCLRRSSFLGCPAISPTPTRPDPARWPDGWRNPIANASVSSRSNFSRRPAGAKSLAALGPDRDVGQWTWCPGVPALHCHARVARGTASVVTSIQCVAGSDFWPARAPRRQRLLLVSLRADAGKWVGTVSAQQIVESANMPPARDLSGQSLRQDHPAGPLAARSCA